MLKLEKNAQGFRLFLDGLCLMEHSAEAPALFVGRGREDINMHCGNFNIRDRVEERFAASFTGGDETALDFDSAAGKLRIELEEKDGLLYMKAGFENVNRIWLRLCAEAKEHVTGGGEQFSCLDLRGRLFPIWTREQGVGRNKLTELTRLADALDGSGGDYHTTFFPQPSFVSSRKYFAHLDSYCYSELDFREKDYHEIHLWSDGFTLIFGAAESYEQLLFKLTGLLGRQSELPQWAMKGIWLGVQGGTERATRLEQLCKDGGIDISAVWIQDWEGKRVTSFGKRLQWDWRWNKELYPDLDKVIQQDETAWMAYINPYLVEGGLLFEEAREQSYLVKNAQGQDYLFDFGEFNCGVVDLTSPAAYQWYKDRVVKGNILDMGFKGYMADFGEYLPADCVCANGNTGLMEHNRWPMLWAKLNYEALEESGKLGDCVFFMRSGAAGSQRYSTLTWAGDQSVDWSEDDGLPSVITAALSLGMSGYGLHCSDAGGYTTLFHLARDRELMLRWLEFACFTPVMRTHEGNRPESNFQLYSDSEIIADAARLSRLHNALLPYMSHCVEENSRLGLPVMRPLFMVEDCERAYDRDLFSYLLGGDMLVAPVVKPGVQSRELWLPGGEWVHLWSGEKYSGDCCVAAPMGKPPVFYREDSRFAKLFESIAAEY